MFRRQKLKDHESDLIWVVLDAARKVVEEEHVLFEDSASLHKSIMDLDLALAGLDAFLKAIE